MDSAMMCAGFILLLFLTDGVSTDRVCSYQDVIHHLNLTRTNEVFTSARPVKDHTHLTVVKLDMLLYAILGVIEKTQTFIPFVWVSIEWNNEHISWDPSQFCGITQISVPKEMLWKPDLYIYEMTVKDEAPPSPYYRVSHEGAVSLEDDIRVVSTCRMDVHKFPFDTQRCNITVGSIIHNVNELQLVAFSNSSRATQFSRKVMQTQGEWDFIDLSVTNSTITVDEEEWEQIIYTVTMKRRPLLHVINFLLPVLFFLCLDLASFFISDHRGEKLGFKVTVLLAISVLLLILNDILPSMSNKTPLIATYCIVIFALMSLSLLETIFATYLMEKDSLPPRTEADGDHSLREDCEDKQHNACHNLDREKKRWTHCRCICDVSGGDTPCELLPIAEQVNKNTQTGESHVLLLILEELKEVERTLALFLSSREEGGKPGYWTRVSQRINTAFFIGYMITVSLFLWRMYTEWSPS